MSEEERSVTTIDEYIPLFAPPAQERMRALRALIRETAPQATEKISWQMPTFVLGGSNLIHFACSKRHIGLYPGSEAVEHFAGRMEAEGLNYTKGGIQLPDARPLPLDFVRDVVLFCIARNESSAAAKAAARKKPAPPA